MRRLAVNMYIYNKEGMGKLKEERKHICCIQSCYMICFSCALYNQSSLWEGSGSADHGGDSSPTKCLINMLSIAMNFKKRNLRQKNSTIYFNWDSLHVCIKRSVPKALYNVPLTQSLLVCAMLKYNSKYITQINTLR